MVNCESRREGKIKQPTTMCLPAELVKICCGASLPKRLFSGLK